MHAGRVSVSAQTAVSGGKELVFIYVTVCLSVWLSVLYTPTLLTYSALQNYRVSDLFLLIFLDSSLELCLV